MRISRASFGLTAIAVVMVAAAGVAIGQQKPESILPPGFNSPSPAPAPRPAPKPSAKPVTPTTAPAPAPSAGPAPTASVPVATSTDVPVASGTAAGVPAPAATDPITGNPLALAPDRSYWSTRYPLPESSRRDLKMVGIRPTAERMMNPNAFGTADGRYIEQLMRRTRAPIASRWVSIALRRLLVQPLVTPRHVNGADFAAERAWLLLRMGESVLGRAIVQSVDPENYTPKLYQVAMQAALATGDVGAMCPLATDAVRYSTEPAWVVARGMCASLSSSPGQAPALMKQAQNVAGGIDLLLAQKIAGKGTNRGDETIEWGNVTGLNSWRYGLAMAAGEEIPDALFEGRGIQMRYWQVLSPRPDPVKRAVWADRAAGQGVLSNIALVDLYGAVDAGEEQGTPANAVASDLRNAYAGPTRDARLGALKTLWGSDQSGLDGYGRLVLTARAASRITVAGGTEGSDQLIASMLSAGLDRGALRWSNSVSRGSLGWALLTLANPDASVRSSSGDIGAFSANAAKQKMFAAGLAGLGRVDPGVAQSYGVDVGGENAWTKAIDRAAAEGRPGEVLVLCATGLQTNDWRGVSPAALFHIVNGLRIVGLGGVARMVAVEAVTRA